MYDEANSTPHEDRYITIDKNKMPSILYVVYVARGYARTRLTLVRGEEPHEKRLYPRGIHL